jgi:hypothetical protein
VQEITLAFAVQALAPQPNDCTATVNIPAECLRFSTD